MLPLDYKALGAAIKRSYIEADGYQLDKYVPAFNVDGKFIGDFFNYIMLEPQGTRPPLFYHIFSPYDVISHQAPQYAAVMQGGKLLYNNEFTPYVRQRTGVMTAVMLESLGYESMRGKRVLAVGVGQIARCALAALKAYFPDLAEVSFISATSGGSEYAELARSLGVAATAANLDSLSDYDVIMCHTSSKEPVLTADMTSNIKPGAFISVFASEDHAEVAEAFYDTDAATVIIDWEQTIVEAPELKAAVGRRRADASKIIMAKDLFEHGITGKSGSNYTIYRSHGTPMQNLAALKLLLGAHEAPPSH